ncbi:unnamed protein product [Peniophora sp. CBMAI 1063]|nr:unnamed protein product [Peniophora sp. CBMAI 1063]
MASLGSAQALQYEEIVSPGVAGLKSIQELSLASYQPLNSADLPLNPAAHGLPAEQSFASGRSSEKGTIHSLPVEVLSMIFAASIQPLEDQDHNELIDTDLRLVCRKWRDVIDSTPQLWTYVLLRQRRFTPKQLSSIIARSKACPLELRVHIQCLAAFNELLAVLQPEMARTRYLYLSCEPCNMHLDLTTRKDWPSLYNNALGVMRELMKMPTPMLEVLDLRMMQVSDDVFSGVLSPNLRSIHLLDCNPVPPGSSFFSAPLTSLVIDYCRSWETVDDMLATISAMPHLQRFQWDTDSYDTHPLFVDPGAYQAKSLHLHKLEHLELSSSIDNVMMLVGIIDFPPSASLIVSGELFDRPAINTAPFNDFLNRVGHDLEPHVRRSFVEETTGFTSLTIHAYRGTNEDGFGAIFSLPSGGTSALPKMLEFGVFWDEENRNEYLAILQRMFTWPGMRNTVTRLVVDHELFMATESRSWYTIMRALPSLTEVSASGPAALHFVRALRALASSLSPAERGVAARMKAIVLIDVKSSELSQELLHMLHERKALCLPPLDIDLKDCTVDEKTLSTLRAHAKVKSVQWSVSPEPAFVEEETEEHWSEEDYEEHALTFFMG